MIEKKEIEYAVELDDVMVLVVEIIKTIKNKESYITLLDDLITAVNGIDKVGDEFRDNLEACINTVTLRSTEIGFLFAKKKEAVVA